MACEEWFLETARPNDTKRTDVGEEDAQLDTTVDIRIALRFFLVFALLRLALSLGPLYSSTSLTSLLLLPLLLLGQRLRPPLACAP